MSLPLPPQPLQIKSNRCFLQKLFYTSTYVMIMSLDYIFSLATWTPAPKRKQILIVMFDGFTVCTGGCTIHQETLTSSCNSSYIRVETSKGPGTLLATLCPTMRVFYVQQYVAQPFAVNNLRKYFIVCRLLSSFVSRQIRNSVENI